MLYEDKVYEYWRSGNYSAAEALLTEALSGNTIADSDHMIAWRLLYHTLMHQGKDREADNIINQYIGEITSDIENVRVAVNHYWLYRDDSSSSLALLDTIQRTDDISPSWQIICLSLKCRILCSLHQIDDLSKNMKQMLDMLPAFSGSTSRLYDTELLQELVTNYPILPETHDYLTRFGDPRLAIPQLTAGELEEMREVVRKATNG